MPIEYEILENKKIVLAKGVGVISGQDVINHLKALSKDDKYVAPMKKYVDYNIDSNLRGNIDEALNVLTYHGIIDDSVPDEPEISCILFKKWFMKNQGYDRKGTPYKKDHEKKVSSNSLHNISVEVKPIIIGGSVNKKTTDENAAKMIAIIDELIKEILKINMDARSEMRARHEIEKAKIELEQPESGEAPKERDVKGRIENAQKLGPFIGQTFGWLSAFL